MARGPIEGGVAAGGDPIGGRGRCTGFRVNEALVRVKWRPVWVTTSSVHSRRATARISRKRDTRVFISTPIASNSSAGALIRKVPITPERCCKVSGPCRGAAAVLLTARHAGYELLRQPSGHERARCVTTAIITPSGPRDAGGTRSPPPARGKISHRAGAGALGRLEADGAWPSFDLVIGGGRVSDGTGGAALPGRCGPQESATPLAIEPSAN